MLGIALVVSRTPGAIFAGLVVQSYASLNPENSCYEPALLQALADPRTPPAPPPLAHLCVLFVAFVDLDPRRVRAPATPKGLRGGHIRRDGLLPEDPAGVSRLGAGAVPPAHARQGGDGRHAGVVRVGFCPICSRVVLDILTILLGVVIVRVLSRSAR